MLSDKIFCNVPWTNLHIYWDGSFGTCCSEKERAYSADQRATYNIQSMTVDQWYNSEPMQQIRKGILNEQQLSMCRGCYHEEAHGYESRRIKENFKSVIFTEQAFYRSYNQSPMNSAFESSRLLGTTDRRPIDWHVDLGNECNLACKMCNPEASSRISSLYKKWNLIDESANRNWTSDPEAWANFKQSILNTPNLNRIHFMGGEPLLNKRFPELIGYLIAQGRTDISISFVTNGTILNLELVEQLKRFRSCDIEVSLESIHPNNNYIRQGSNTLMVIDNIKQLISAGGIRVVLRSVPQLLNVNNYDQYILWAWTNQLSIQGIPLIEPEYLKISVLPKMLRQSMIKRYEQAKEIIGTNHIVELSTGRGGSLQDQLRRECDSVIAMLSGPEPDNVEELRVELVKQLMRWDQEFEFDALDFYPEYYGFLTAYGYQV